MPVPFSHPASGLAFEIPDGWNVLSPAEVQSAAGQQHFPHLGEAQQQEAHELVDVPALMLTLPLPETSGGLYQLQNTLRLDIHARADMEEFAAASLETIALVSRFATQMLLDGFEVLEDHQEITLNGVSGLQYRARYQYHHAETPDPVWVHLAVVRLDHRGFIVTFNFHQSQEKTAEEAFNRLLAGVRFN